MPLHSLSFEVNANTFSESEWFCIKGSDWCTLTRQDSASSGGNHDRSNVPSRAPETPDNASDVQRYGEFAEALSSGDLDSEGSDTTPDGKHITGRCLMYEDNQGGALARNFFSKSLHYSDANPNVAQENRLWKELCHKRWARVNARPDCHQRSYASLNGWRNPRLKRTILNTRKAARTRAGLAAMGGSHARNISGIDIGPSQAIICTADSAWCYKLRCVSKSEEQSEEGDVENSSRSNEDIAGESDGSSTKALRGVRAPGWIITDVRLSADEENCFFGTVSGHIYVSHKLESVSGDAHMEADGGSGGGSADSRMLDMPLAPSISFASTIGTQVAVRQIVSSFEGSSPSGAKLGVLCRPSTGWQPHGMGASGGYFFLVDTERTQSSRTMLLGEGSLGGHKFPSMDRGGIAISVAPVSSDGMSHFEDEHGGGGELFAVGFSGGAVALLDGRSGEQGGMVGGFVSRHRWLERIRSAGSLLMASYGRSRVIETWDMRKLPCPPPASTVTAASILGTSSTTPHAGGSVQSFQQPQVELAYANTRRLLDFQTPRSFQLDNLACSGNAPDFWAAPHGLTVAIYGAPRGSQSYGAKHSFWPWPPWPPVNSLNIDIPPSSDTWGLFSRSGSGKERQGAGNNFYGGCTAVLQAKSHQVPLGAFSAGLGQIPKRTGVEMNVACVVNDVDYRLKLSTGIKVTNTHMATVLDETRILIDEILLPGRSARGLCGPGGEARSAGTIHLVI